MLSMLVVRINIRSFFQKNKMASVQQLEKLHQIERIFHVENSLEAAVAGERVRGIISRTEQIMKQRAFLREERRRLRVLSERLEERKRALIFMEQKDWIPLQLQPPVEGENKIDLRIKLNIGGLIFEVESSILSRDKESLLASLNSEHPLVSPDVNGIYTFDRDWWLFRFILNFLRDGVLPDDRGLLAQLYKESSFWKLTEMQHAIEQQKLHLPKSKISPSKKTNIDESNKVKKWWEKQPNWWASVIHETNKSKEISKAKAGKDWWTASEYKGRDFSAKSLSNIETSSSSLPGTTASKLKPTTTNPTSYSITEGTWSNSSENIKTQPSATGQDPHSLSKLPDPYSFVVPR